MLATPTGTAADLSARRRAVTAACDPVLGSVSRDQVQVHRRFTYVSGFIAHVTEKGLGQLQANPAVVAIDAPQTGSAALAQSVPQIRADAVHRRDDGGQGVTVAVLDTGVDSTHPDLAGSIVDEQCFCSNNCCPDGTANQSGPGSATKAVLHGTHVTGIIVSKGLVAPAGVAPAAKVVAVKVLDDSGYGQLWDWISALDWIAANRPDVQAVNMSLESETKFFGPCDSADATAIAFAQVIGALRDRGTLTFVASGNYGLYHGMSSPACISSAVAVGAVSKHDAIAPYSDADLGLDLLAPGGMPSAPDVQPSEGIVSTGLAHSAQALFGTSMATPHATGTAALLLAFAPTLSADELEGILKSTGMPIRDGRNGLVYPRLNTLAALNAAVNATRPLSGGGTRAGDCLVEWNVNPPEIATTLPYVSLICRDNDPSCDQDQTVGQCTFALSACFNVTDRRLPRCSTGSPIVEYRVLSPPQSGSAADASNAAALRAAVPPLPLADQNACTGSIPIVVPVGQQPRSKSVRSYARAADGRRDSDRLRLTCLPANP